MAAFTRLQKLKKLVSFYGRFTLSFTGIGYTVRGLPWRPVRADYSGQNWLVTAATSGIGRGAAMAGLAKGARVFAVGRNKKALTALVEAARGMPGTLVPVECDVSSVSKVSALADQPVLAGVTFDAVVNNVGILTVSHSPTPDGFEASYATNLLGHYILVEQLVAHGQLAQGAVIVEVVSGGLYNAPLNVEWLDQAEQGYNGYLAYAAHKRAQLALVDYWREKFAALGIRTYAFHPGWVDTDGVKRSLPTFRKVLRPILRTEAGGADTIDWLIATKPDELADKVWFDRKARSSHAYASTRQPRATVHDVLAVLERDWAAFKDPAAASPPTPVPAPTVPAA